MESSNRPSPARSVAVIGAGLGGLACASLLSRAGCAVTVFEKNDAPGGKMGWLEDRGYTWDMGPSLLTMPEVLDELWRDCGEPGGPPLDIVPLPCTCRYRWSDGTVIDENAAFWARPDVARFLDYAAGIDALSGDLFLRHDLPEIPGHLRRRHFAAARHLPKILSPRTVHATARRFFDDPHLVQLFGRFATYNGSSPYLAPSVFNIIPFVQARHGGHYVRGGMHRIARATAALAEKMGARFRYGTAVEAARPDGANWILTWEGGQQRFDAVACNMDALSAAARLFPPGLLPAPDARRPISLSGFVLFLGVNRRYAQLAHHNILFSDDYRREFDDLFGRGLPAENPTIYIAAASVTEPSRAPAGCDAWFVLVNAPPTGPAFDWASQRDRYAERILERIEASGFDDLRRHIEVRHLFTPQDFAARHWAWRGSLYGYASHGLAGALRRPPIRPRGTQNLVFVGGTTHPGGGVPLVLRSGEIAARRLLATAAPSPRIGHPDHDPSP